MGAYEELIAEFRKNIEPIFQEFAVSVMVHVNTNEGACHDR